MVFLSVTHRLRTAAVLALMIWGVSFFLHFFWEMVQVPFFSDMAEAPHWDVVWLCIRATIGDANIAVMAYAIAASVSRDWLWSVGRWRRVELLVYFTVGLVVTVVFEAWATGNGQRWTYSERMPVFVWTGTGLLPLAQWVVLPWLTLLVVKWMFLGWLTVIGRGR